MAKNKEETLTAAKWPNWERKDKKSNSWTAKVPSTARDTASSTWNPYPSIFYLEYSGISYLYISHPNSQSLTSNEKQNWMVTHLPKFNQDIHFETKNVVERNREISWGISTSHSTHANWCIMPTNICHEIKNIEWETYDKWSLSIPRKVIWSWRTFIVVI